MSILIHNCPVHHSIMSLQRIMGAGANPSWHWARAGFNLHKYIDKQPFTLTFTPTCSFESLINLHVFGLWEEAGAPGGNPHRHEENMQTPHRKAGIEPLVLHWSDSANWGWEILGNSRYDTICDTWPTITIILQYCDNQYIARQLYYYSSQCLFNWIIQNVDNITYMNTNI